MLPRRVILYIFASSYLHYFSLSILIHFSKPTIWKTLNLLHALTAKKWSFPLRISSINVTKSAGNCRSGHIYWRNLYWKTSFFVKHPFLIYLFSKAGVPALINADEMANAEEIDRRSMITYLHTVYKVLFADKQQKK